MKVYERCEGMKGQKERGTGTNERRTNNDPATRHRGDVNHASQEVQTLQPALHKKKSRSIVKAHAQEGKEGIKEETLAMVIINTSTSTLEGGNAHGSSYVPDRLSGPIGYGWLGGF